MPSLAEMQQHMAGALIAAHASQRELPAAWFAGPLPAAASLRVHRNTVIGGCVNALRLSFPAVARLLGEATFDALAADFARAGPPRVAVLALYGEHFPRFIARTPLGEQMPQLVDLAAFEWQFDQLARSSAQRAFSLDGWTLAPGVTLRLARTLRLHRGSLAVDELRDRVLDGEAGSSSLLETDAEHPRCLALWRRPSGVAVQALSPCAARFIDALLDQQTMESALQLAQSEQDPGSVAALLQSEVLQAGFAQLSRTNPDGELP